MLIAGFVSLTILLALLLLVCSFRIAGKAFTLASEKRMFKIKSTLVLAGWLSYIYRFSVKGVFSSSSLPPRIPLLLVMPAFIFFIYFFTNKKFKKIIDATPVALPVYFQSFRIIVELLIVMMFFDGLLPKAATFEGYNFDIVIGITAPFLALLTKKDWGKKIILLWNFAGLCTLLVVVFILLSYTYSPSLWGSPESSEPKILGVFPFTFLAGFLMPVAVFLHVFSLIKIKEQVN